MASLLTPPPCDPGNASPERRPGSIRRTSTMLMYWPGGLAAGLHLKGRARDLLSPHRREPEVIGAVELEAVTGRNRDIVQIESHPALADLQRLVGFRAGSGLRGAIAEQLPAEVEGGTPLHLLLDDVAGSTLIAGYAWFRWADHVPEIRERLANAGGHDMRGICAGFREGSSALRSDGSLAGISQNTAHPSPLADPNDPWAWHELDSHPEIAMRRARRIDVWRDGARLQIDAMFRDSCWDPDGRESVVHEYQLLAEADAGEDVLLSVTAEPRVLPYAECTAAAANAPWVAGTNLRSLRGLVLERIKGTDCCTHLNDALRALAEVPILAHSLEAARASAGGGAG